MTKKCKKARLIAIYLPQFHPIPENDEWHGKGFTEWTNVAKAKPLFKRHYQPLLPADLGFYDLRIPEVQEEQAKIAREHGVEGFCYWHYWFGGGRRILEKPFERVLRSGKPDFPFCLGWANASWTGIWYGMKDSVILEQQYLGQEDDKQHFYSMLEAFKDPRYLKVNEKPIFFIYQPTEHPYMKAFIDYWHQLARSEGFPGMYFIAAKRGSEALEGFDAITLLDFFEFMPRGLIVKFLQSIGHKVFHRPKKIIKYAELLRFLKAREPSGNEIPIVVPNFDNTARSGNRGTVIVDPNPLKFLEMVKHAVSQVSNKPEQERIIFIEAWNEWAEGNYLEPDARFGSKFLEVIKKVMDIGKND